MDPMEMTPASSPMVMEAPAAAPVAELIPVPNTREERMLLIQQRAMSAYTRAASDWINFFREILGADGIVLRMFPTAEELAEFEKSQEHAAIQQMLTKLRERDDDATDDKEPTRVITVRLPKSLHESLKAEAHLHRASMNQLCISKLLQLIDNKLVPNG
jgi:predicted HicB family RNase H-like nuclease